MFKNSRVVYSTYLQDIGETFSTNFAKKLKMEGMSNDDMKLYKDPSLVNLKLAAMRMSDGIIKCSDEKNTPIDNYLKKCNKPVLGYHASEDNSYVDSYSEFYDELLQQEPVLA